MAYRTLAGCFGVTADIVYEGQISHPENLALVNLLEIAVLRWSPELDLERYAAAVGSEITWKLNRPGEPG
jgi:nanoRNase/pAp phosphatase (c-di-AMP/oligoRNAs hydrolase)